MTDVPDLSNEPAELLAPEPDGPVPEIASRTPGRIGFPERILYTLLLIAIAIALAVCFALDSAQTVPEFYAQVLNVEPQNLEHGGDEFERNVALLNNACRHTHPWKVTFTQEQINGWLASDLPEKFPDLVSPEISEPRLVFTENEAKLAFKYSKQGITGIVVAAVDVFCTEKSNQIALKLKRVKSGVVTLPIGPWLEDITQRFHRAGIDLIWTEEFGDPVALITIPDDVTLTGQHRQVVLEAIDLRPGRLVIAGSSVQRQPAKISEADQSENSTQKR